MIPYGHTHPDFPRDPSKWESLPAHLQEVAEKAADFASRFGCAEVARKAGLWHDFGKFSDAFQNYLKNAQRDTEEGDRPGKPARGPDHATAGARHAVAAKPGLGHLLAYAIAGHHAGLPDGLFGQPGVAQESSLKHRLNHSRIEPWEPAALATLPAEAFSPPEIPAGLKSFLADGYAASFWTRMLFSCLVDADFLATEAFMNEKNSRVRDTKPAPSLAELETRLDAYMAAKQAEAEQTGGARTPVNRIRAQVRDACLAKADDAPGLFSLTVPTGGGKTLASLAFALRHARRHGLERIVYVIPFTSIIEQNAAVFRAALGDDAVLEHHSNFVNEPEDDASEAEHRAAWQTKLAAENWDAPLVVTTGVQFFESLHAHKPSRCRKLHRLAKSVIILDEAQTLPVPLLQPCLRAIEQLAKNYGSTVILCTATQPAVGKREKFECGLEDVREIIPTGMNLHDALRRVTVERIRDKLTDEDLAARLAAEPRVLCVVNTRRHARELFEKLRTAAGKSAQTPKSAKTVFHLSAQMCPAHRTEILDEVRHRLKSGEPVRLVSTQLIEAGVDVDFPCVYRSLGGLDAIAQAAGRCNREGRLPVPGRVFVFESADYETPAGFLKNTAAIAHAVIASDTFHADILAPEAIEKYFRLLYWEKYSIKHPFDQTNSVKLAGKDHRTILGGLIPKHYDDEDIDGDYTFAFRTLGENFRLIEETSESVIVPYGDKGYTLTEALRAAYAPSDRMKLLRKLQRYAVSIPKPVSAKAVTEGRIQNIHDTFPVLVSPESNYSPDFGVALGERDGSNGLLLS